MSIETEQINTLRIRQADWDNFNNIWRSLVSELIQVHKYQNLFKVISIGTYSRSSHSMTIFLIKLKQGSCNSLEEILKKKFITRFRSSSNLIRTKSTISNVTTGCNLYISKDCDSVMRALKIRVWFWLKLIRMISILDYNLHQAILIRKNCESTC